MSKNTFVTLYIFSSILTVFAIVRVFMGYANNQINDTHFIVYLSILFTLLVSSLKNATKKNV